MKFPKGDPKLVVAEFETPVGTVNFLGDGTAKLLTRDGKEEALTPAVANVLVFCAKALNEAQTIIEATMVATLLGAAQKQCNDPNCKGCVARRKAEEAKAAPAPQQRMDRMFGTQN